MRYRQGGRERKRVCERDTNREIESIKESERGEEESKRLRERVRG